LFHFRGGYGYAFSNTQAYFGINDVRIMMSQWTCRDGETITVELNLSDFFRSLHFWRGSTQLPNRIDLPNNTNFYFAFSVDSGHETKFISLEELDRGCILKPALNR
jgi:hypothetical protein